MLYQGFLQPSLAKRRFDIGAYFHWLKSVLTGYLGNPVQYGFNTLKRRK